MHFYIVVLLTGLLFVPSVCAEQITENSLPDITVVDSSAITTAGASVIDRQTLQSLPQGDGAMTDLLKVLPGVQFSEVDNSSLTGGEILPAEISISGGRVYDNNFMIDGISNNSLLDPMSDNPTTSANVPGHSQELFLDTSLIDSITVYRSNISSRYSGFSGGVVDVETRDPAKVFSMSLGGRTTRSEWASFHVDRLDQEEFTESTTEGQQPEFRQYYGYASLDIPLSSDMAVLVSYTKMYSDIPLFNFGVKEHQYRNTENFFIKYLYQPTEKTSFRLSFLSTPYEGEYFREDVKESDYSIQGGGWSWSANLEHQFSFAKIETVVGLRESENTRRSPDNYYNYKVTPSVDWGTKYSRKGGFGDAETIQQSLNYASHVEWRPLSLFGMTHEWIGGVTFERTVAEYERTHSENSGWKESSDVVCLDGSLECIVGEQYAYSKVVYPEDQADAEISFIDLYLEDSVTWGALMFRPGIHFSYNDFTQNSDYAARGALFYDLFSDGSTIVSAGLNRYYGKTLLTHALAEEKQLTDKYTRTVNSDGTLTPWVKKVRTSFPVTRISDFDTPYVDEWSVGLETELLSGQLTVTYVDRDGEDLLGKTYLKKDEDGYSYSEWNNNGESRHHELTFSWQREWQNYFLLIDGTWQDSESSNEDYDDRLEIDDLDEIVWYNNHSTYFIDLPRSDYNREWSANLIYSATLSYGFSFTNIIRYRSGYEAIGDTGENYLLDGEKIDIYDAISYPSATTFDWKIEWEYVLTGTQTMTICADITNVFNRKIYTGVEGEYQMGRQLWVGVDYRF